MPFTRRSLLTGGAAAVPAAMALASQTGSDAGSDIRLVRLPKKVRLAMVGFDGHPGEILDPLERLPDVEFVAVAGAPADVARQAKNRHIAAARKYVSLPEMLDKEKPDVVGVCNNNGERAGAILECARRRVHVIAEKPFAINGVDYRKVRQTVKYSGVAVGMLLPMRFDPPFAALKKIVDEGLIGEVIQVSAQKSYTVGSEVWRRKRETYGSTILWIGIHMIDLMRWSSGREFIDSTAWQNRVGFPELGDQENVSASVFRLDNGGLAILRMDYLRPKGTQSHGDDRLRLAGTKGVAEYMAATGVTLMTEGQKERVIADLPKPGSVLIDFLRGVYDGQKRNVTEADIWRVNEITLAAHESADAGGKTVVHKSVAPG